MENTYSPVNPFFYDLIDREKTKSDSIVFYFGKDNNLEDAKGRIESIITNKENAEYLLLDTGSLIRLDRIIVINGIPGPAYDEYDAYSLACLDCSGGMDL